VAELSPIGLCCIPSAVWTLRGQTPTLVHQLRRPPLWWPCIEIPAEDGLTDGLYRSANAQGMPPSAEVVAGYAGADPRAAQLLPEENHASSTSVPTSKSTGGLRRSSAIMAAGTVASRTTGFVRSTLLLAALGSAALGDVFNTANTIPNIVYDLLLGGVLTAAHVPLLIRARNRSERYGEEFEQRLFTALVVVLGSITVGAMVLAPVLINMYGSRFTAQQHRVAVLFLLFFLPQIFFYGFAAVAGASLNSRGRFGAPMWAPVLNNIAVILVLGVFMATTGGNLTPDNITDGQVTFLGIGVTAGVAAQAFGLIPAMRSVKFNFRPRFDFRRAELTSMWSVAGWSLLYVVAQQAALLIYTNLANAAGRRGVDEGLGQGVGLTPWINAYAFFQLPFAVVAISVITAILPRMTQSAAEGRLDRLALQLREGLRLSLTLMLPAAALLFGAASEICFVLFAHGDTTAADAEVIAQVLRVFAVALTPFTTLQLLQRGFYALSDTRTPAFVAIFSAALGTVAAAALSAVLSTPHVVLGIAAAQGIAWTCGCLVSFVLLRRRIGRLGGREILVLVAKTGVCSFAALLVAQMAHLLVTPHLGGSLVLTAVTLLLQGIVGGGSFLLCAVALRIPEVTEVVRIIRGKIVRRPS
jgi:putative peptidoglycan lipid II flippase